MPQFSKVLIVLSLVLVPVVASALEFKSVSVPKAVLYDAPSSSAKKILLLSQYYPVEIIVNLSDWLKVRDAEGSLSWVETKQLSDKRTVMITISQAEIRQAADANASLVATLEKGVLLEVVDTKPNNGWLKVRHRDGAAGFVLISSTWGFN
ncbi:MAG: SH3 domain-containing protein [Methylotenera sp.]|nr:SH3 domain-containing protein [Methylotenera sp.]